MLGHGWAGHGRDYVLAVEVGGVGNSGQFRMELTHCVQVDYETRVEDEAWQKSWGDEFTDSAEWEQVGEPEGYLWGTNWSLAYPGIRAVEPSSRAEAWAERLKKPMFEALIETDRFLLRLVFHSIRSEKTSSSTSTISQVIIPLREGWWDSHGPAPTSSDD